MKGKNFVQKQLPFNLNIILKYMEENSSISIIYKSKIVIGGGYI